MKFSLIILSVSIFLLYITLEVLNFFVAGFPSYKNPKIDLSIHDLINEKSNKFKSYEYKDFLRVYSKDYKKLNYTGKLKKISCGPFENGKYNLIFKTDKYGFRENHIKKVRSKSGIFLFGSRLECSPLVLYESASSGLPFISFKAGNSQEIAKKTGAGIIVDTIGEMAKVINELFFNKKLNMKLSKNGIKNSSKFSWKTIAMSYLKVFKSI